MHAAADPLAVAWVVDATLFECRLMRVDVETGSERCAGETICDIFGMSSAEKNCYVATKVDVKRFWDLMISATAEADKVSTMNKM